MRFSDAFRETLHRFDLKASDVAMQSGLTRSRLSQFRNGTNIRIDTLEKILDALPAEARMYMLKLVAEDPDTSIPLPERDTTADSEPFED